VLLLRTVLPQVECPRAVSEADQIKVVRALRATPWVLGGFYYYHLWNHILWLGNGDLVVWLGQGSILSLVAIMFARQERYIWLFGALSVALFAGNPSVAFVGALLTAALFAVRVWQGAPERLLVGVALLLYLAAAMFGWRTSQPLPDLPGLFSWQTLLLVGALLYLGWRKRQALAWFVLAAAGAYRLPEYSLLIITWFPESALAWGAILLVAGFLALSVGLAVNWWLRNTGGTGHRDGGHRVA